MTYQTAETLGKYLGKKILIRDGLIATLTGVSTIYPLLGIACMNENGQEEQWEAHPIEDEVYPILKDYTQLIEPMEFDGETIIPIQYVYGIYAGEFLTLFDNDNEKIYVNHNFQVSFRSYSQIEIEHYKKLGTLGFGAIQSESSPTGWVDLCGNFCVCEKELRGN